MTAVVAAIVVCNIFFAFLLNLHDSFIWQHILDPIALIACDSDDRKVVQLVKAIHDPLRMKIAENLLFWLLAFVVCVEFMRLLRHGHSVLDIIEGSQSVKLFEMKLLLKGHQEPGRLTDMLEKNNNRKRNHGISIADLGQFLVLLVNDQVDGVPDHSRKHDEYRGHAVDIQKGQIRNGGQDAAVYGPSKRDRREHGREEQREPVLIPAVVHHEREEHAQRYHECRQQTIYNKVAGLAGHATLHGDRRIGAHRVERVRIVLRALRYVIFDRMYFDVDVVVQLPYVFVQRCRFGHLGRYVVVLYNVQLV